MFAPDNIPTVDSEAPAPDMINTPRQAAGGKEGNTMANNLEELRQENPALAEQLMAEARAAVSASGPSPAAAPSAHPVQQAAEEDPVQAERRRLQDIDALAALYDAETIRAAKYGPAACTDRQELSGLSGEGHGGLRRPVGGRGQYRQRAFGRGADAGAAYGQGPGGRQGLEQEGGDVTWQSISTARSAPWSTTI